jgi:hypothetical protein
LTYIDAVGLNIAYEYIVTAIDEATNETLLAGIEPRFGETMDIVIDDDAGWDDFGNDGYLTFDDPANWRSFGQVGSNASNQSYPQLMQNPTGGDLYDTNGSSHGQWMQWTTNENMQPAVYEVFVNYLCNSPRPIATYEVYSGTNLLGTETISQSQYPDGTSCGDQFASNTESQWASLGQYTFNLNYPASVRMIAPSSGANITADAVGFRLIEEALPPVLDLEDITVTEIVSDIPTPFGAITGMTCEVDSNPVALSDFQLDPNVDDMVVEVDCSYEDPETGLTASDSYLVTVQNNPPTVSISDLGSSLSASVTPGNPPYTFLWSGDCSGANPTTSKPATPGTYTCHVLVTDLDGDTADESITFTVESQTPPGNNGQNNQGVGNPSVLGSIVTSVSVEEGSINGDGASNEKEEEDEILGEEDSRTCEVSVKVSGYVYIDQNENDQKDGDEKGIESVLVEVFYEQEGNEIVAASITTDENGYWEAFVCPGDYKVRVKTEELPEGTELASDSIVQVNVEENNDLSNINFKLYESDQAFNWSICLIPLAIFLVLIALWFLLTRKKDTDKIEG